MKLDLKKELAIIIIVLLPFIYLAIIWNSLPNQVPTHWNFKGEIDAYGNKLTLLFVPILLPLLTYVILLIIPKIDPKKRLNKMGKKFYNIKFLITTLVSILAVFIIYSAKNQSFANSNYIILGLGVLYIVLGNNFKTIRPNYFIGIRTPWTLESEAVWKKTHKSAGKMWFIGGLILVFTSLTLNNQDNLTAFIIVTSIITVIPIIYSYVEFKKTL